MRDFERLSNKRRVRRAER